MYLLTKRHLFDRKRKILNFRYNSIQVCINIYALRILIWIIWIILQSIFFSELFSEHPVCVQCTHKHVERVCARVDSLTIDRAYHSLQHNSIVHIICTLEIDDARHGIFTYALSAYRVSANTVEWKRHECPGRERVQCFLPLHPTKAPLDAEKARRSLRCIYMNSRLHLGESHRIQKLRSLSLALRWNWIARLDNYRVVYATYRNL